MKLSVQLFLGALLGTSSLAGETSEITTIQGTTYTEVQITKVEPDGIRIIHAGGAAKIPFEQLEESDRKRWHFDKQEAKEYREDQEKAIAKERAERKKAVLEENAVQVFSDNRRAALEMVRSGEYEFASLDAWYAEWIKRLEEDKRDEWASIIAMDRAMLGKMIREARNEQARLIAEQEALIKKQQEELDRMGQAEIGQSYAPDLARRSAYVYPYTELPTILYPPNYYPYCPPQPYCPPSKPPVTPPAVTPPPAPVHRPSPLAPRPTNPRSQPTPSTTGTSGAAPGTTTRGTGPGRTSGVPSRAR